MVASLCACPLFNALARFPTCLHVYVYAEELVCYCLGLFVWLPDPSEGSAETSEISQTTKKIKFDTKIRFVYFVTM